MKIEQVKKLSPEERFTYWIRERESIRLKREAGKPRPWTDDAILQSYRFCNVRRMDDKVSRWLYDNWYGPYRSHPNMIYASALARFFNLPSSLMAITTLVFNDGGINWTSLQKVLREKKQKGETVFNGAYMVRGNDGMDKIECVVDYYVRPLNLSMVNSGSMRTTWENIIGSYGMGSFMAGQIVADLRWAVMGAWADRSTWAPMGPGSKRGLNRFYGRDKNSPMPQDRFLEELLGAVEICKSKLSESITSRLECHDYQNCFCEYDKFSRVLLGEGKPKQKYAGIA